MIILRETATRMNVSVGDLYLMRISTAAAYAMPAGRQLLFSQRLLELLSDDELAAVAAHELAHLSEGRTVYFKRYVIWLMFLPWVLFNPMVHTLGPMGFFILAGLTAATPVFYRSVCRELELRADHVAQLHESESGTCARALLKLHEDALIPAVHAKQQATHPHLYDRLLAAGMQPDFPRPTPSRSMAWNGFLFSVALGLVAMVLVIRLTAGS